MMNSYEAKRAARKERQAARAERLQAQANALYRQARRMAEVIPFGQPILVGHHSEKRDRNYREFIHNKFAKAFELDKAAQEAATRAQTVSNAISSDDADAPEKLRERIAALEASQAIMIAANKIYRLKLTDAAKVEKLLAIGLSETAARSGLQPDFAGRIGFPGYALTNNNANIRRLKERLAGLERKAAALERAEIEGDGWRISEDREDNRLLITFNEIPARELRERLKRNGFKWSPSRSAWVRMLRSAARYAAQDALTSR